MEGWGEEAPSKAWSGGECGNVVRQQARQRCPRRSWSSEWGQVRRGLGKVHSDPDSALAPLSGPGFNPWVGKIPWSRKWQPTSVLLPGIFYGLRSYSPWDHKESGMAE